MNYDAQLKYKYNKVYDALVRIGKLEDIKIDDIIPMEEPYRYRNKIQLPVGMNNDEIKIGFYKRKVMI